MSASGELIIQFNDFQIPGRLVDLTGSSRENFASYGMAQFRNFTQAAEILPHHTILEIGSGVGRLAIPACGYLSAAGGYIGIDYCREAVDWCTSNISPKHPNSRFHFENVFDRIRNPHGAKKLLEFIFPATSGSVDRVIASSVFTHLLPQDAMNYLAEIHRVLKPGGIAQTTLFLLNPAILAAIQSGKAQFSFEHPHGTSDAYRVQDPNIPESAVAYSEEYYLTMCEASGLQTRRPIIYGTWSGISAPENDGQDYVVLRKHGSLDLFHRV